jgi:hypothetical protein
MRGETSASSRLQLLPTSHESNSADLDVDGPTRDEWDEISDTEPRSLFKRLLGR